MSQPKWKTIMLTDDMRVMVDETGVYPPEMEISSEIFDAPKNERFIVHRIVLEPMQLVRDDEDPNKFYMVGKNYKPDWGPPSRYEEWFVDKLPDIARSVGQDIEELIADLTSGDPKRLAWAYRNIGDYHGFANFDSDPLTMSEAKLNKRWK